jgi:hypothetical protein
MNIMITLRDGKPKGSSSIPDGDEVFHFLQSVQIDNGDLHNRYWWLYWLGLMALTDLRLRMRGFIPPYRGADKSLAPPGRKQAKIFLPEWREFPSASLLLGKKMITARVSILLKSRASLTCFQARFLTGRAKDLPAPRYNIMVLCLVQQKDYFTFIFYCDVMQFCGCSLMKSG